MVTMPIHEAIEDDPADYHGVTAYRAQAGIMLDQIAGRSRQALDEQGIDLDLFVAVPNSGDAIINYGTTGDPTDELWSRVSMIVSEIVRDLTGVSHTRCRGLVCAHTTAPPRSPNHPDGLMQQSGTRL
jgi:hypothetical protein